MKGTRGSGPPDERARLVESVAGVIEKMARTFASGVDGELLPDLRSAGQLGALEAAAKYDHRTETSFEAYAWPRIAGAMVDLLRKERPRLPPQLATKLDAAVAAVEATIAYAAELRYVDAEDLEGRAGGGATAGGAALLCMGAPPADPEATYAAKELVERAVRELPERDQTVVVHHLLEGRTFEAIAGLIGVHEKTVRERYHAAMRRLDAIVRRLWLRG